MPPRKQKQDESLLSYKSALEMLSEGLVTKYSINIGSFGEFIRDVWSKGYEKPEWFNTWHVQFICEKLEKAIQDKKYFCAVLPRYHMKCLSARYVDTYVRRISPSVYNFNSGKIEEGTYHYSDNGDKTILRVETEFGRFIEVTKEHPFLVFPDRWVKAEDLKLGDFVASPIKIPPGNIHSPDLAALYGYLIGDGSLERCSFYQKEEVTRNRVILLAKRCGFEAKEYQDKCKGYPYVGITKGIRDSLRKYGLLGSKSANKFVPSFVMEGDLETVREFIQALFECDAHFNVGNNKNTGTVTYYTISEVLARDVQYILLRLGIRAKLWKWKAKLNGRVISDCFGVIFHTLNSGKDDLMPYSWRERFAGILKGNGLSLRKSGIRIDNKYRTTKRKFRKVAEFLGNKELLGLANNDVSWEKVTNIENLGVLPSTAVEAAPYPTLTAGGFITHNSTTLGYGFSVWSFLKYASPKYDSEGMYLSYSDSMSVWHISQMKAVIRRNPILVEIMDDRVPQADYSFRYKIGNTNATLLHGGLFSFKRGSHVNRFLVADDLLRDPANPLDLSQILKVEEHFRTESMYIPNPGAMVVVLGTPMAPDDLLAKLRDDERFIYVFLPALNPTPDRRVLCPEIRTEEQLLQEQKMHPHSFASEMMLQPYLSTMSYFSNEDIQSCENKELKSLNPNIHYDNLGYDFVIGGCDVGKKRHPSHVAIFGVKDGKMTEIFQQFLDGWPYVQQVEFLNMIASNFKLDMGAVDNTRGELEERGLSSAWQPVHFTRAEKRTMAQQLEQIIHGHKVEFIADERQRLQITCVDNELKSPESVLGHGEGFVSCSLAARCYFERFQSGVSVVGNVEELNTEARKSQDLRPKQILMNNKDKENLPKCPKCGHYQGWVPELKVCIICYEQF